MSEIENSETLCKRKPIERTGSFHSSEQKEQKIVKEETEDFLNNSNQNNIIGNNKLNFLSDDFFFGNCAKDNSIMEHFDKISENIDVQKNDNSESSKKPGKLPPCFDIMYKENSDFKFGVPLTSNEQKKDVRNVHKIIRKNTKSSSIDINLQEDNNCINNDNLLVLD